jgi:hypothetical protein
VLSSPQICMAQHFDRVSIGTPLLKVTVVAKV